MRVLAIVGTRPEAIKMAPVVHALRADGRFDPVVCATGQHRDLLRQALALVDVRPDVDLDVMQPDQTLATLTVRLLERLDRTLAEVRPDWVLVQGDTTSAFVGALAAFYRRIPIGHVEAGLRTGDVSQPFPEELNRRVADACADLCFAPTAQARAHLLREGVPAARIHVTGNTIVDAVRAIAARPYDIATGPLVAIPRGPRWVLVTAHRRESFGAPLDRVVEAVRTLAAEFGDAIHVIVPTHPNPQATAAVAPLRGQSNCSVIPALEYPDLLHVLSRAALALTDSGGIQEEAPSFGVPVLVLREKTERPEGLDAGVAELVGTDDVDRIVVAARRVLTTPRESREWRNPYGDGHAAERIVGILAAAAVPAALAASPPSGR